MNPDPELSAVRALAPEARVRVTVNGKASLEWCCTPDDLRTLAVGWLVSEGVVRAPLEVENIGPLDPEPGCAASMAVDLAPAAWQRLRTALSVRDGIAIRPATLATPSDVTTQPAPPGTTELRPLLEDRALVSAWFREMFDRAALRSSVGGVHTGGLVVDGKLTGVVEDVSRHHVVDRLVGSAFLAGARPRGSIFLVSARISGAMAAKACRAGIGAVVSRSVPTELAAFVAGSHGLILVGRARREDPHYYWPPEQAAR